MIGFIALWVVNGTLGIAALAWGVHLRREELRQADLVARLRGGAR